MAPSPDLPDLLGALPPSVGRRLRGAEHLLLARVLDAVRASSELHHRPLSGPAGRGIETGVRAAVELDDGKDLRADHLHVLVEGSDADQLARMIGAATIGAGDGPPRARPRGSALAFVTGMTNPVRLLVTPRTGGVGGPPPSVEA